jgi:signal transduction histidine kinase
MHGERWRAYTIVYSDRIVQVSQADEVRREIASNAALRALLPVAILFPLSWLLIVSGVGRILKPLDAVARAATQRDASSLSPLPVESVPQEIVPLVIEMNGLIQRVGKTLDSQRHFVLDAAHELRTPLAALQLQIENLSQSSSAEDREVRVNDLKSGIQRATHLVSQLLHMARYDAEKLNTRTTVNLGELVKSCLADFIPIAEARKIDLGMVRDDAANIWANADDLRILFCNLLDNAIRYTHVGGKIDIGVIASGQEVVVEIGDTGPGIPEHLLSRVFDRFFRVEGNDAEGSGIGLAIVSAIASRENAEVILVNSLERSGLVAKVTFQCVVPA